MNINRWRALRTVDVAGSQGSRLDLWRHRRLWFMAESGFLIEGFEGGQRWGSRRKDAPGRHKGVPYEYLNGVSMASGEASNTL